MKPPKENITRAHSLIPEDSNRLEEIFKSTRRGVQPVLNPEINGTGAVVDRIWKLRGTAKRNGPTLLPK